MNLAERIVGALRPAPGIASLLIVGAVAVLGSTFGLQWAGFARAQAPGLSLPDGRKVLLPESAQGARSESAGVAIANSSGVQRQAILPGTESTRSGAVSVLLPDGTLLVHGGSSAQGRLSAPLAFTWPELRPIQLDVAFPKGLPSARTDHFAATLPDGRVLMVGGRDGNGAIIPGYEVWDPTTGEVSAFARGELALGDVRGALLGDGRFLIRGVRGQETVHFTLDPNAEAVQAVTANEAAAMDLARVAGSPSIGGVWPGQGIATDRNLVSVRFSQPMDTASINADSVTLFGPGGVASARVMPSLDGMLAYLVPDTPLYPGSSYTIFVKGVRDAAGNAIAFTSAALQTAVLGGPTMISGVDGRSSTARDGSDGAPRAAGQAGEDDDETFSPATLAKNAAWRTTRAYPDIVLDRLSLGHEAYLARREAATQGMREKFRHVDTNRGGIEGLVLKLNDKPLAGVVVRAGGRQTKTDSEGRFELDGLTPGSHEISIDGSSASRPDRQYGQFFVNAAVEAGRWTRLPHAIYVARIRDKDWSNITSPAVRDTVLTHPEIPDLEVHIPRGAVLRDRQGKALTRVAIVPIPVDRAAFPPPANFPVYFSLQPGGLNIQGLTPGATGGIKVVYPNRTEAAPGAGVQFVDYDPEKKGWHRYGTGRVSADGRKIVPDAGVGLYKAMASSVAVLPPNLQGNAAPATPTTANPKDCGSYKSKDGCGDPVHTSTGIFAARYQDMAIGGFPGGGVQRIYRTKSQNARHFGIGSGLEGDLYLYLTPDANGQVPNPITQVKLVLPSGDHVPFNALPGAPSGGWDTTFESASVPGEFFKAKLYYYGSADTLYYGYYTVFELVTKNGDRYVFNGVSGALTRMVDRFGNLTSYIRSSGNIDRVISPSGRTIDFQYGTGGVPNATGYVITKAKDSTGREVNYQYSAFTQPGTGTQFAILSTATFADASTQQYTYDANGNMLTARDRRGNVAITNQYDANQRVTQQTLAGGAVFQFAYTLSGSDVVQTDVTDPRGTVTRFTFNSNRYPTQIIAGYGTPLAQTTTYTYQSGTNLLLNTVDALNRTTAYTYDSLGNMLTATRLSGTANAVTDTYTWTTAFNQVATYKNALNQTTTFTYDSKGNLQTVANPLGHTYTFTYNQAGQVLTITDPLSKVTTLTYDLYDLRSVQDPLSRVTVFQYDLLGRRSAATDPLGNRTRYQYNTNDLVTLVTNAQGGTIQMQYDANGNLTQYTDPESRTTAFVYDVRNRTTTKTDPLLRNEAYSYDGNSNLTQRTDRRSQVSNFTYDALNRMTTATWHDGSQTKYTFDAAQRVTQAQEFAAGNPTALQTINRTYDGLDRLTQEQTGLGTVSYGYNAVDQRTSLTLPGQAGITYTWDAAGRLTQIQQATTPTAKTIGFTYDNAGRRTQVTLANGLTGTYTYDNASQLTGITYLNGATSVGTLTYGFDNAGRIVSQGGTLQQAFLPAATTAVAVHSATNALTSWNATALNYDNHGNLTSDGTKTYTWDVRNRLVQVSQGATTLASYTYDPYGRRIKKVVNGTTTQYVYDGANSVVEADQNGTVTAAMLAGLGMDEWYMRTSAGTARHYLRDLIGSTRALADDAKAIQTQYQYEPYGEATASGAAYDNPFQYTGRENDGYGLYYYRARYYSPSVKRFVAEDPIGFMGGANVYGYVGGNPISIVDPRGLDNPGMGPYGPLQGWKSPDLSKFIESLRDNARATSIGMCARYVRTGLEAGGADTTGHPISAKDWGPLLEKMGFYPISQKNYLPEIGDVIVIPAVPGHPDGHIQAYDGNRWISDFLQRDSWPGPAYRNVQPSRQVYRMF